MDLHPIITLIYMVENENDPLRRPCELGCSNLCNCLGVNSSANFSRFELSRRLKCFYKLYCPTAYILKVRSKCSGLRGSNLDYTVVNGLS